MSMEVLSVTVSLRCDGFHCEHAVTITSTDLPSARGESARLGWRIGRAHGYGRVTCPTCAREDAQLVAEGIVNKQGMVLDMVRYDAWLDQKIAGDL